MLYLIKREDGTDLCEVEVHFRLRKLFPRFETEAEALAWLRETERKSAKGSAYRSLTLRALSSTMLRSKLEEKGYSKTVVDETVQFMQEYGYIQDEEFWAGFVRREFQKGNGPRAIEWKGKAKGLPPGLVRELITDEMQREKIRELKRKGPQSLARKGFDFSLVLEIFQK